MNKLNEYLGKLVMSQLENTKPDPIPEDVKFDDIVDIARRNHMNYILFNALLKSDSLDEEQEKYCKGMIFRVIVQSSTQKSELAKWEEECEKRGIMNQPMKGAIMKFLYPNCEMREMSDLDILIGQNDMDKTAELLKDMGYDLVRAIKHHDIYRKKPFMIIEAHRDMYDKHVDKGQYEYFAGFSRAVLKKDCKYTYVFNDEDFYVYMVAHAAKHFYEMGCGIRNIIDVYLYRKIYEGKLNEEYLQKELEKCGIASFAKHMENLALYWLENKKMSASNAEFYDDLFQYMSDSGIYGKDANGIWNKFSEENKGEVDAKKLQRWYYFPPVTYMAKYYPWLEEHPGLLPWAWVVRLCRGVFLHKGAKKREMVSNIDDKDIDKYRKIYCEMQLKFKS